MRVKPALIALFAVAGLGACGETKQGAAPTASAEGKSEVAAGTLAGAIVDAPGMTTVAGALKETGLATVFDGTAPYTLLAPDDNAFGALGDAGRMLKAPENSAAMAEVLKAHVLPGFTTVADIDAALAKAAGKPVKMATMDGAEVSFARDGDALTVTAADGAVARIDGKEVAATNGVAIPIDTVLKTLPKSGG